MYVLSFHTIADNGAGSLRKVERTVIKFLLLSVGLRVSLINKEKKGGVHGEEQEKEVNSAKFLFMISSLLFEERLKLPLVKGTSVIPIFCDNIN